AFQERSVRAPVTPPAIVPAKVPARVTAEKVPAENVVANRAPIPASARRTPQLEATPPRIWPRLILYTALLLIAAASSALYIRSRTGAYPPVVAKLESKLRTLTS